MRTMAGPPRTLEAQKEQKQKATQAKKAPKKSSRKTEPKGTLETILTSPTSRQIGRTAASILTRTLLGVLGLGGTTRRRRKSGWF